jgi:hypothetical protein
LKEENNITKILESGDENVNTCIGPHHVPNIFKGLGNWAIYLVTGRRK